MACSSKGWSSWGTSCCYWSRWFKISRICNCWKCSKEWPQSFRGAQGYQRLINDFSYDQEKVSKFIGKSRSYITNCLRILTLPSDVLNLIETKKLSTGHAKILVGLENASFVAQKIIEKKLSVRQSENFVKIFKKKKGFYIKTNDPNIQNLEKSISDRIGLNVSIKNSKKNKGTITFMYHDIEQLNKIIDIIKSNY